MQEYGQDFMGEYTSNISDDIWEIFGPDEVADIESVIAHVNKENAFRSFGDGLYYLMKQKNPDLIKEAALSFLKTSCQKTGVPLGDIGSDNSLRSWVTNGPKPKKGEDTRKKLFALAFALELNLEETKYLFEKVYMDRAFNHRNEEELVYYYCLINHRSWADANYIINKIDQDNIQDNGLTQKTEAIVKTVSNISSDDELLNYINNNRHNIFQYTNINSRNPKSNKTALTKYRQLLEEAKNAANEEEKEISDYRRDDLKGRWRKDKPSTYKPKKPKKVDQNSNNNDKISNNYLYYMITNQRPEGLTGSKTIFKDARLPQEIKNRFPQPFDFNEDRLTYESLRKIIILLKSYTLWRESYLNEKIGEEVIDFEAYIDSMNFYLQECGFSELYYGNPFDWLFMICAIDVNPLQTFRWILSDVIPEEEKVVSNEE